MKKYFLMLVTLLFATLLMVSGCSYREPEEEIKPSRGQLSYHGPDISGERIQDYNDEETEEPVSEAEDEDEEETVEGPGYFSILEWLPFERDLWGRSFVEDSEAEEESDEEGDLWDDWEPYIPQQDEEPEPLEDLPHEDQPPGSAL